MLKHKKQIDMTEGNIALQVFLFALPLFIGDMLQQLYNTIDSIIVGNFVGKQALAAVGSTSTVVNILVGLFVGIATGATVVISRRFGAHDKKGLTISVRTTFWLTLILGAAFTVIGIWMTPFMLRQIGTTDDVFSMASQYLIIYFGGISGLVMYNMCAGILRAVGDSTRPLYVLIFSSFLNIALDLLFIIPFSMGVAGAALATIISQFISAVILIVMLYKTESFQPIELHRPTFDKTTLSIIFGVGLPFGLQRSIISFSNTIVLSFVYRFSSAAMAAWSIMVRTDFIIQHTMQSMAAATTTFVSQNIGAKKYDRIKKGVSVAMMMSVGICAFFAAIFMLFRYQIVSIFNRDADVLYYGGILMMVFPPFQIINSIIQIKSGELRGFGYGKTPTVIAVFCYVIVRQIYLHVGWNYMPTFTFVAMSFPFAWMLCLVVLYGYDHIKGLTQRGINAEQQ